MKKYQKKTLRSHNRACVQSTYWVCGLPACTKDEKSTSSLVGWAAAAGVIF